jgi:hypothetical protein
MFHGAQGRKGVRELAVQKLPYTYLDKILTACTTLLLALGLLSASLPVSAINGRA